MLAFAVLKEVSEYWTETDETRGSTLKDVGFWAAGIAMAVLEASYGPEGNAQT